MQTSLRRLLLVLALLSLTINLWAACAFDAVSNSGFQSGASTYSWNHTVTGSNTVLYVGVQFDSDCAAGDVTGITYNSVAMTHIDEATGTCRSTDGWYLLNPTTGTNAIQVTYSSVRNIYGTAVSLTGVGSFDLSAKTNGGSSNTQIASSITTTASNDCLVTSVFFNDNNATGPVSLAGTSPTTDFTSAQFAGNFKSAIGHDLVGAAGPFTETWTNTGGSDSLDQMLVAAFKPSGGVPSGGATITGTATIKGAAVVK